MRIELDHATADNTANDTADDTADDAAATAAKETDPNGAVVAAGAPPSALKAGAIELFFLLVRLYLGYAVPPGIASLISTLTHALISIGRRHIAAEPSCSAAFLSPSSRRAVPRC